MLQEGYLESCLGTDCPVSCCARGHGESLYEYKRTYFGQHPDKIRALGIIVSIRGDRVWYDGCCWDDGCRVLDTLCIEEGQDIRPLDCKIFPYKRGILLNGDGDTGKVQIYLQNCPATNPDYSVPEEFTEKVIQVIKEHFLKVFEKKVDVEIVEKIMEC